ncbi:MAG: acyltransferase family protein [Clostridiales bacterium]|nr:acyltransferase family protein [Clostridiales bacterium]
MKQRERFIDIARGIAMLLVILGHCSLTPDTLKWWLYSFHIPLFFALSGLVFNPEKYVKFKDFLKSRVKSLLIPYFFLSIVLWFITTIVRHNSSFLSREATYVKFIGIFVAHRNSTYYFALWFVLALFLAEILFYFIVKLTKKNVYALIASMIVLSVGGYVLSEHIDGGFYWSVDVVPVACSFLIFGFLLKLWREKSDIALKIWWFPVLCAVNLVFSYLNHRICGRSDLYYTEMGNYFYYMLAALSGIWAVLIFCKFIKKFKVLEFIGKNTLVYYTFHKTFLPSCIDISTELATLGGIFANEYFILALTIVMVCTVLAIMSVSINKCFPFLLGRFARKEKKRALPCV